MCLSRKLSPPELRKWLEKQPDIIIAWKVVDKIYNGNGEKPSFIGPVLHGEHYARFKKRNVIKRSRPPIEVFDVEVFDDSGEFYFPNFHLFVRKIDAVSWKEPGPSSERVIKCSVPKKQITAVGMQGIYQSIVTKEFTFILEKKQKREIKFED